MNLLKGYPTLPHSKPLASKVACVTGCCGFVGVNLVQRLLGAGWTVIGFDLKDKHRDLIDKFPNSDNFKFYQGDVTDEDALLNAIPDKTDFMFHLASNTAVRKDSNNLQDVVNICGTENVVNVCKKKKIGRLVHTSSIAVYFPSTHERISWFPPRKKKVILTEETPRSPDDFWVNYCRSKCIQEKIVQSSDINYIILQPSDIIGRYDDRSWGRLIQMMAECRLVGIPDTKLNFVNVDDVVEGHLKAALYGVSSETYILGGTPYLTKDLISEMMSNIKRILGRNSCTPKQVPLWLLTALGCIQDWFDEDSALLEACNSPEADKSFPRETIFLLSSQHTTSSNKAVEAFGYSPTDTKGVCLAIRHMADHALAHLEGLPPPTTTLGSLNKRVTEVRQKLVSA